MCITGDAVSRRGTRRRVGGEGGCLFLHPSWLKLALTFPDRRKTHTRRLWHRQKRSEKRHLSKAKMIVSVIMLNRAAHKNMQTMIQGPLLLVNPPTQAETPTRFLIWQSWEIMTSRPKKNGEKKNSQLPVTQQRNKRENVQKTTFLFSKSREPIVLKRQKICPTLELFVSCEWQSTTLLVAHLSSKENQSTQADRTNAH